MLPTKICLKQGAETEVRNRVGVKLLRTVLHKILRLVNSFAESHKIGTSKAQDSKKAAQSLNTLRTWSVCHVFEAEKFSALEKKPVNQKIALKRPQEKLIQASLESN